MSNKVKKAQNKKNAQSPSGQEILKIILEYIAAAAMIAMCVAVSFYAEDGYNQIGNAKFAAYRAVAAAGFSVFLLAGAAWLSARLFGRKKRQEPLAAGFRSVKRVCVRYGFLCVGILAFFDGIRGFRRVL